MPATYATRRQCPYCGAKFFLAESEIVATNFEGAEYLDGEAEPALAQPLPSGVQPKRWLHKRWPVVAPPPMSESANAEAEAEPRPLLSQFLNDLSAGSNRSPGVPKPRPAPSAPESKAGSLWSRARAAGTSVFESLSTERSEGGLAAPPLPPLADSLAAREELRARACPECSYPLPRDIDDRKVIVVAIVGANRVGKTHFIAASLTEASQKRGLAPLRCEEFTPDDDTSRRFREKYFLPLFRQNELLRLSQEHVDEVRFQPLVFNVTLAGREPFSLVVHDIAGEALGDPRLRARAATFLRAARGIIFLIDPREIDTIRDKLPEWVVARDELGFDQGALLATCLQENGVIEDGRLVPVAITVGKADLLAEAYGALPFLAPGHPETETLSDFAIRTKRTSRDVAAFLEETGAHNLLSPADVYRHRCRLADDDGDESGSVGTVTFHAVSALGTQPGADDKVAQKVAPLNCAEPLAAVLAQICDVEGDLAQTGRGVGFVAAKADPLDDLSAFVEAGTESPARD